MISFDLKSIKPAVLQAILQTAVAPRPIALASTIDSKGNPNLSPYSFFNIFSTVPPILIFSPSRRVRDNSIKHTLENIEEIPEVVIGNVSYSIVQQTSLSSTEYEKGVNEFTKAGFTMKDANLIRPKLIMECPVNFECKVLEVKKLGDNGGAGNLVICEILTIHIQEAYLDDTGMPDLYSMNLVGRLGGNLYSTNDERNLFEVPKPLVTKGIGIDSLPENIKKSKILSGNDLALLANIETLHPGNFSSDEKVHLKAKGLLENSEVQAAWEVLRGNS